MDDQPNGEALRLHMLACDGCGDCRRHLTTSEARELAEAVERARERHDC